MGRVAILLQNVDSSSEVEKSLNSSSQTKQIVQRTLSSEDNRSDEERKYLKKRKNNNNTMEEDEVGMSSSTANPDGGGDTKTEIIGTSYFESLPTEILLMILTNLHLKDRRSARLVCKYWEAICRTELLSFKPPVLNNKTVAKYSCLQKTTFKFDELDVWCLTKRFRNPQYLKLLIGSQIRTLKLSQIENTLRYKDLEQLLKSCCNLEELIIESTNYFFVFKTLTLLSLCKNLRSLRIISEYYRVDTYKKWLLDCKWFTLCKKLETIDIRATEPIVCVVHNEIELPASVVKCEFYRSSEYFKFDETINRYAIRVYILLYSYQRKPAEIYIHEGDHAKIL